MRFLLLTLLIPSMLAMVGCAGNCYNGGYNYGTSTPQAIGPFAMIAYANNLNTWQGDGCGEVYRNSWINNPPQEKSYDPCGRSLYPSEHYYQAKASNGYYRGVPVKKCCRGVSNGPCYCDNCLSTASMNSGVMDGSMMAMGSGAVGAGMMDGSMIVANSYPVDAYTTSWNGASVWGDGGMTSGGDYTTGYPMSGNMSYDMTPGTVVSSGSGNPYASQNALGGTASPEYVAPLAPGPTVNRQAMIQSRPQFQASNTPNRLTPVQDPFRDQLRTLPQNNLPQTSNASQMVAATNRSNQVVPVSGTASANAGWTASPLGNQTSLSNQASNQASNQTVNRPNMTQTQTVNRPNTEAQNAVQNVDPSSSEYQTKMLASLPFDPQLQPGEYIVSVNWGPETQSTVSAGGSMPVNGGVQPFSQNGMAPTMPTAQGNGQQRSLPQLQRMPTTQNSQSAATSARPFIR